jgi:hypothetical protein
MDGVDSLGTNPFAVLTFIVAPAVLTNASSILGMQTSNRFARAVDRARALAGMVEELKGSEDGELQLRMRQLDWAERRAMLLVRSLTAFYLSAGSFAGATFAALLGAIFHILDYEGARQAALGGGLVCGVLGVGGLLAGTALLVWETRRSLAILRMETEFFRGRRPRILTSPPVGTTAVKTLEGD